MLKTTQKSISTSSRVLRTPESWSKYTTLRIITTQTCTKFATKISSLNYKFLSLFFSDLQKYVCLYRKALNHANTTTWCTQSMHPVLNHSCFIASLS